MCRNAHSERGRRDGRTVHLALIREDDLPAATWWVDSQGFLEALLDVWAPYTLSIILQGFVKSISQLLTPTPGGGSRHPLCRRGGTTDRRPQCTVWIVGVGQQAVEGERRGFCRKHTCLYASTGVIKMMMESLDIRQEIQTDFINRVLQAQDSTFRLVTFKICLMFLLICVFKQTPTGIRPFEA